MTSRACVVGLFATACLGPLLLTASEASGQGNLTIIPSEAEGVAALGARIGPFEITNSTGTPYEVKVFPVLVGQDLSGALLVRQAPRELKLAAKSLRVKEDRDFELKPGDSRAVSAKLIRPVSNKGFYGGVLFQGTPPPESGGAQVTQVLQLNARVYLEPAAEDQRPKAELTDLRVEQNGSDRLQALISFANTGNTVLSPTGRLEVRADNGDIVFVGRTDGLDVIPGATVELPVDLGGRILEAGSYEVEATVQTDGQSLQIRRPFELFGPNEVATKAAEIVSFEPPQAEEGTKTEVAVSYMNTGNVDFLPEVELTVSGIDSPMALESSSSSPGEEGSAAGSVQLEGVSPQQLTVRLLAEGRELDRSSVSVTPTASRPLTERVSDWLVENALLLMAFLIGLVIAMAITFTVVVRRRRAR